MTCWGLNLACNLLQSVFIWVDCLLLVWKWCENLSWLKVWWEKRELIGVVTKVSQVVETERIKIFVLIWCNRMSIRFGKSLLTIECFKVCSVLCFCPCFVLSFSIASKVCTVFLYASSELKKISKEPPGYWYTSSQSHQGHRPDSCWF